MRLLALILGCLLMFNGTTRAAETGDVTPSGTPASSTNRTGSAINQLDDKIKLNTGDVVTYRVQEDKDPPQQIIITDTGEMEVPYVGRVKAAGRTCKELADELKLLLEEEYYHTASITISIDAVAGMNLNQVNVLGQVRGPGPISIPKGLESSFTLSKAIFAAGGLTPFANPRKVEVIRLGPAGSQAVRQTFTVNLKDILDGNQKENDILIKPGDSINVPAKFINL